MRLVAIPAGKVTVDMTNLPTGVYVVQYIDGTTVYTTRGENVEEMENGEWRMEKNGEWRMEKLENGEFRMKIISIFNFSIK